MELAANIRNDLLGRVGRAHVVDLRDGTVDAAFLQADEGAVAAFVLVGAVDGDFGDVAGAVVEVGPLIITLSLLCIILPLLTILRDCLLRSLTWAKVVVVSHLPCPCCRIHI